MDSDSYHFSEKAAGAKATLFLVLHGTGGDENQFFFLAQDLLPNAHVISLRGDVSEHGALRFFKRTGEGIYDMVDLALRTDKMATFIMQQKRRLNPSRVVGLGYSNGANILASVMFSHAKLFDDSILMHPLIPFQPKPNPGLVSSRILITAGEHDPICPVPATRALIDYFRQQGSIVTDLWHNGGHELRPNEIDAVRKFLQDCSS